MVSVENQAQHTMGTCDTHSSSWKRQRATRTPPGGGGDGPASSETPTLSLSLCRPQDSQVECQMKQELLGNSRAVEIDKTVEEK